MIVALLLLVAQTSVPNRLTCEGYPEPRTYQDYQQWWNASHLHLGGCFPTQRKVSGVLDLDIRLQLHDNAGTRVRKIVAGKAQRTLDWTCDLPHCERWERLSWDTRELPSDGWTKLGIQALAVMPDGLAQNIATDQFIEVVNGRPRSSKLPSTQTGSTAWMPDDLGSGPHGYADAKLLTSDLPLAPLSGTVTIPVRITSQLARDQARGVVSVDPDIHSGVLGVQRRTWVGKAYSYVLDTTLLSNGPHKLMVRSHDEGLDADSQSSVFVWTFQVLNK